MPHCLKQNGMARMLTPIILLAVVMMYFNVMLKMVVRLTGGWTMIASVTTQLV